MCVCVVESEVVLDSAFYESCIASKCISLVWFVQWIKETCAHNRIEPSADDKNAFKYTEEIEIRQTHEHIPIKEMK